MKKYLSVLPIAFIAVMLCFPDICRRGAASGLILCGSVVIPALFPFTLCTLLLMRSPAIKFFYRAFGSYGGCIAVFLLSAIGGYPVGARLVNELYLTGALSRRDARLMLCCCVNAGPAFLVIAVGSGVFGSRAAGYILLCAHLIPSIIMATVIFPSIAPKKVTAKKIPEGGEFATAASDAASAMLSASAFIIFFSAATAYLNAAAEHFPAFKIISMLCEVTSGAAQCKSLYSAAFLTGFAGFSTWMQAFAAAGEVGANALFPLARIFHGALSAFISFALSKAFKINIAVLENGIGFSGAPLVSSAAVSIALAIMLALLILSVSDKNRGGKFLKDLI